MAVNKNFVVKNGIEVNTNLIVADTDSNKVGIGTTVPEYTLHVFEGTGIGASMVYVTGISTSLEEFNVGVGGTTFTAISNAAAGIAGSVGVGTDLPGYLLEVHAPVSTGQTALYVKGDMYVTGDINLDDITLNELKVTGISTFEDNIFVGSAATVGLHTVHFADHAKAMFGDGEDLKIYHDGTSSYVDNSTGGVYIRNLSNDQDIFLQSDDGSGGVANYILCNGSSGQVELFHYGTARFNTNAIGVVATGTFESTGITTLASAGGISTTGGDLYIGGDLYVSDNITLDTNLNILGIATIATLRVSDTATGESGTEALIVGTGLSVRGSSTGVAVTLAGAGGITTTGGDFYVGGDLYISEDVILDTNLEIIGIATIGTLQVSSTSGINTILSTVQSTSKDTGALVIEGGVGIEKNLFVGGGAEVTGITTITGTLDANGALDVDGHTELDDVNVSGASTFTGAADFNGAVDIDGHTELDDVNVSGASTFTGAADFNGAVDIDGHTELDDVNVSGTATITTFNVGTAGQSGLVGITTILDEDNMASDSATALATQQSIKAYVDTQLTAEDLDFGGDSGTGSVDLDSQTFTIAGTANEIETTASSQTLTIGLPNFVTVSNGLNVTGNGSTTTTLNVSGISTFSEDILIGTAATVGFGSTAFFRDDAKAIFGDSEDLQIYHNGTDSIISDTGTGNLNILGDADIAIINAAGDEYKARFTSDGAAELYYNGNKKFETTGAGVTVTGVTTSRGFVLAEDDGIHFKTTASDDLDSILRASAGGGQLLINSRNDAIINIDSNNDSSDAHFGIGHGAATGSSTELFRVQEDGFVGVNTDRDFRGLLSVFEGTDFNTGSQLGIDNIYLASDATSAEGAYGSSIAWSRVQYRDRRAAAIANVQTTSDEDQVGLAFFTHPNTDAATPIAEQLRIQHDGKVGIGTSVPEFQLHSYEGDGSSIAGLFETNQSDAFISFQANGTTAGSTVRIGAVGDAFQAFINGGERFRIASSGQIGLGGANYGTSGQVLTSNGASSAPTWQDASGGGAGGISTTHQQVQSTSATGISTFSTTEYRSAHMLVGITQGTSYQTGRYLIIHDNTTPTILEESALATGDMIATFDATIAGGNLTVRVTMGNAGLATVAVKMDTIKSDSSS